MPGETRGLARAGVICLELKEWRTGEDSNSRPPDS